MRLLSRRSLYRLSFWGAVRQTMIKAQESNAFAPDHGPDCLGSKIKSCYVNPNADLHEHLNTTKHGILCGAGFPACFGEQPEKPAPHDVIYKWEPKK